MLVAQFSVKVFSVVAGPVWTEATWIIHVSDPWSSQVTWEFKHSGSAAGLSRALIQISWSAVISEATAVPAANIATNNVNITLAFIILRL